MEAIAQAMLTMKGIKTSLGRFMQEADSELNAMTQTLNGLMMDSLAGGDFNVDTDASGEETEKILQEASAVAEQQIGDRFPSVPSPSGVSSQSTYE
jgi:division protein CdvB (Snf7/Vps24/ESCRT-III family)